MSTAAQLDREAAAHGQHAHAVAVLLAEQGHGPLLLGRVDIGDFGFHRTVLADFCVDQIFQCLDLLGLDGLEVTEVKTQTLTVDQRALLLHMLTQHLTQRGMQQVRGRVVQCRCLSHRGIHLRSYSRGRLEQAAGHYAMVQEGTTSLGGIAHIKAQPRRSEITAVTDLTAGLGIERRAVKHHHALLTLSQTLDRSPSLEQADNLGFANGSAVAGEFGVHVDLDQTVVIQTEGAGGTRTLALGLHLTLETGLIDAQAALAGDITGQVHGEAVGVVQLEHHLTRNFLAGQFGEILLQNLQTLLQGLGKLLFLGFQHALDMSLLLHQFREGRAHFAGQGGIDLVEEGTAGTELVAVTAGAANDATQHIAAAFVGRQYAVGNQEAAGADMVSHHLQRGLAFVGAANRDRRRIQQALEQVDLVVRVDVLQHGTDAFQPHTGVHARRRQRVQHAVRGAVELHEHVVPDLDVAVAIFFR